MAKNIYPIIKVFVTKKYKLRVRIKDAKDKPFAEVTVGSESWKNDKWRKYDALIAAKFLKVVSAVKRTFDLFLIYKL